MEKNTKHMNIYGTDYIQKWVCRKQNAYTNK